MINNNFYLKNIGIYVVEFNIIPYLCKNNKQIIHLHNLFIN